MTETEIETVTVDFEELKANVDRYYRLKETKRLRVIRDGKELTAIGPWLPGEDRWGLLRWFELLYEMFPEPWIQGDPENGIRSVEESRGYRPFATSTAQRSSNSR